MSITDFFVSLPEPIITERLILRVPNLNDAKALAHLLNNKNIHKMLARVPYPYQKSDAIEFINDIARTDIEHGYAIIDKNDVFMGLISFVAKEKDKVEIGYWLGEPFWGKGIMSEALKALINVSINTDICPKLLARVISTNITSINMLKKLGFIVIKEKIDNCGQHENINVSYLEYKNEIFRSS